MTRYLNDLSADYSKVNFMINFDVVSIFLPLGGSIFCLVFIAQAYFESQRIQVKCAKA
jgi:hypothetical protein